MLKIDSKFWEKKILREKNSVVIYIRYIYYTKYII